MKKYKIIINTLTSLAYINDLKCVWGDENNVAISFDTLEELFAFANKHNITLSNSPEMQTKMEAKYIERVSKLEYYFYNKGVAMDAMWSARNLCLGKRIQQLEVLAFATQKDIDCMPLCNSTYEQIIKRLEDKVFGITIHSVSSSGFCYTSGSIGTISIGQNSTYNYTFFNSPYKPKKKVGESILVQIGSTLGSYKISTIAMCYCAKTNQIVLAYCCGREMNFNCELLDRHITKTKGYVCCAIPEGVLL